MTLRRFFAPALLVVPLASLAPIPVGAADGEQAAAPAPATTRPVAPDIRAEISAKEFRETPVMREETKLLIQWLEDIHYLNTPISEEIFNQLVPEFMSYLDEQRMF